MNKKYYTEKEKEILENYFLHKTDFCKHKFEEYLQNFILENGICLNTLNGYDYQKYPSYILSHLHDWQYDTKNFIWNEDTNDNIVTYMLSHPKFEVTNASIKELNKLRPNWGYVNNGSTVLHYLAKQNKYQQIEKIIKYQQLEGIVHQINNEGEHYIDLLLKRKIDKHQFKNPIDYQREIKYIDEISQLCLKEDFLETKSSERIKVLQQRVGQWKESVQNNSTNRNLFITEYKQIITKLNQLENILYKYYLDNSLSLSQTLTIRNKI